MIAELAPRVSLGQLAAFLLPGAICFRALAYHAPGLQSVWNILVGGGANVVGPALVAAVTALTCGMGVSAIRTAFEMHAPLLRDGAVIDYRNLDSSNLAKVERAIEEKYRYAQFAGNSALATLLLACAHCCAAGTLDRRGAFLMVVALPMTVSWVTQMGGALKTIRQVLNDSGTLNASKVGGAEHDGKQETSEEEALK